MATTTPSVMVRCAAPVLVFTAEEVWQARFPSEDGSVHFLDWPELPAEAGEDISPRWLEVRRLRDRERTSDQVAELDTGELPSVTARVVALDRAGTSGPERITLDVGRRDGVRTDSAVVAPDGLVGRVVSVGEWSADVSVIGSPGSGVGVRTGAKGVIGTLSGSHPTTTHAADELVITQLTRDRAREDDEVVTLGSPGQRPYPPGVPVGTVTRVERAPGQLTDTAVVEPAVDLATVDVVAVVTGPGRAAGGSS